MHKAISIWSFSQGSLREKMLLAKDAGFDGIELALEATGEVSLESTSQDLQDVKKQAEDIGLALHSLASSLCWENSFASDDAAERAVALELVEKQIATAAALGAKTALVVPGSVHTALRPGQPDVEYDLAYERNVVAFRRFASYGAKCGVVACVENVWNKIFLSPLEMRGFVDEIGGDGIGVYFDVGNVMAFGFPEHWIKILGNRIKKVHFKDYRSNTTGFDGFVDLLSGEVNWPRVMQAFAAIGYNGWYTAEMIPPYTYFPEQILYNTSQSMDKILRNSSKIN